MVCLLEEGDFAINKARLKKGGMRVCTLIIFIRNPYKKPPSSDLKKVKKLWGKN